MKKVLKIKFHEDKFVNGKLEYKKDEVYEIPVENGSAERWLKRGGVDVEAEENKPSAKTKKELEAAKKAEEKAKKEAEEQAKKDAEEKAKKESEEKKKLEEANKEVASNKNSAQDSL